MNETLPFINRGLTQRAADGWESARFTGSFLALGFFCSQAESTLRPPAANASRWAASKTEQEHIKQFLN
jgi:hypothetical protein